MNRRPGAAEVLVHWLFVGEAIVLVATGLYLHSPLAGVSFGIETFLHLVAGYAVLPTVAFRIYWSLYGRQRDQPAVPRNVADGLAATRRYAVYVLLWLCLAAEVVLGLALRFPTEGFGAGMMHVLGGMATVRIVHYCLLWVFVSLLAVHAYGGLLSGWPTFRDMFVPRPRDRSEKGRRDSAAGQAGTP